MKKIYCAYGDEPFHEKLLVTEETALSIGKVDEFYAFRRNDLNEDNFLQNNIDILSQQPGGGFWAWKPFVILKTMEKVDDGDIVLHTSTGMKILENLDPLFEITEQRKDGRMLFSASAIYGSHKHSQYTKRDCFVVMGLDGPEYWDSRMLTAAHCLFTKTPENIEFLKEWLRYTTDRRAIWDTIPPMPNRTSNPNLPGFLEHRYDQAILSLLSVKYGRELYRDPTQFGIAEVNNFPNSPYGQLFYQYD
jgi:hypothetical protein